MSPTDEIPILRVHLQELYGALDGALGYHQAQDIARSYQNLGGANKPSNLTRALEKQINRLSEWLREEEEDVPQE